MKSRQFLEWVVLAVSALAIAVLAGILLIDGLTGDQQPADPGVELRVAEGRAGTHGWLIPATVTNRGDDAAEDVVIEATATGAGTEESSQVTIAFLPPRSAVDVDVGFSARPDGEVTIRVVGFAQP